MKKCFCTFLLLLCAGAASADDLQPSLWQKVVDYPSWDGWTRVYLDRANIYRQGNVVIYYMMADYAKPLEQYSDQGPLHLRRILMKRGFDCKAKQTVSTDLWLFDEQLSVVPTPADMDADKLARGAFSDKTNAMRACLIAYSRLFEPPAPLRTPAPSTAPHAASATTAPQSIGAPPAPTAAPPAR